VLEFVEDKTMVVAYVFIASGCQLREKKNRRWEMHMIPG
jgi:hypothetical protein